MSGTATLCSLLAFLLLVPTAASAKIYKWTDEKGTTVFSNTLPGVERTAKDLEVVVEDEKAPTLTAQQIAYAESLRREQQLEERIYNLERQVQTQQQYQPQYQPMMTPPPPDYYGGSSYYPGYAAPYIAFSSGFARPAHRRFSSPRFSSGRFASFQHGGFASSFQRGGFASSFQHGGSASRARR
jgi:hypothetical protein